MLDQIVILILLLKKIVSDDYLHEFIFGGKDK